MKKFLLFAAGAAAMMCASAQVNVEQLWKHDVSQTLSVADCRQGFGMNGKIFINDKANQKVVVFGQGGLADEEYPGGANTGCTRDEAGNIITILTGWAGNWTCDGETPTVQVVNPNDPTQVKQYFLPTGVASLPADAPLGFGRCDLIGFAKGDLMTDGVMYLAPSTAGCKELIVMTIADGEVDLDNTYVATIDGSVSETSSTPINYYINASGEERLLYVNRTHGQTKDENGVVVASTNVGVKVLAADGDNFVVESTPVLPNKSASNGAQIFVWDGEEYAVYPMDITNNYRDGIAIVKLGDTEPTVICENTLAANPNSFQANWVNAEVNATDNSVIVYHYVPGAYLEAYKLTKGETPAEAKFYVCGGFNGWNTNESLEITEEGATFDVVEDPNDVESKEFKILTPAEDGGWIWLGGIDNNNVGYFEVTEGMMTAGTEIELYANDEAVPNYANFRLPGSGNYTITLAKGAKGLYEGAKIVVKQNSTPTAITDVNSKAVKSVKYVNIAGQVSEVPFDGVNVVVTTYTDGTRAASKVIK